MWKGWLREESHKGPEDMDKCQAGEALQWHVLREYSVPGELGLRQVIRHEGIIMLGSS